MTRGKKHKEAKKIDKQQASGAGVRPRAALCIGHISHTWWHPRSYMPCTRESCDSGGAHFCVGQKAAAPGPGLVRVEKSGRKRWRRIRMHFQLLFVTSRFLKIRALRISGGSVRRQRGRWSLCLWVQRPVPTSVLPLPAGFVPQTRHFMILLV